ncbi:MAG TPA: hypothetical protein P5217_01680 [Methanoregulaceae archaeon]|nr:hypothetical protein [Methanoregulaceae archaeon]
MQSERSLIFVYNADSDAMPRANDLMSRPTGTLTDPCSLINLTFSPIGMKKEWKRFISGLRIPVRFLARDEFISEFRTYAAVTTFPEAFLVVGKDLFVIASTEEIRRCGDVADLIAIVEKRLAGS